MALYRCMFLSFISLSVLMASWGLAENPPQQTAETRPEIKEQISITQHQLPLNGKSLSYTATTGTYILRSEQDKPRASIFYIAYTADNVDDRSDRPVTFCFNGGPGSSSVWLHLGTFGPKRIVTDGIGFPTLPYQLEDNPETLLAVTDLVFIDPISTGFSRAAPGEDVKQFHGYEEDIASVAEFIRLYLGRNNRWNSPKFLAGESYGTTRAAGLSGYLFNNDRIYLDGIILVSSVLDFSVFSDNIKAVRYLPTYSAIAWYYQLLKPELQRKTLPELLREVEAFSIEEYAPALLYGNQLTSEKRKEVIQRISEYTSLSPLYVERANLNIPMEQFAKELLRDQKRTIGRFDGRFLGIDANLNGQSYEYDPSIVPLLGAFTAAMNHYVRSDLNYVTDLEYRVLTDVTPWKYGEENRPLDVSNVLRTIMTKNPNMNVFVISGYFDLAIPYFSTEGTFDMMNLAPEIRSHLAIKNYMGGHMLYLEKNLLKEMNGDLLNFYRQTLSEPQRFISLH